MIRIDMEAGLVVVDGKDGDASYPIGTQQAFAAISRAWIRSGWDAKYVYSFSWMGRPVIQLPEDMLRIQEAIYQVKPDVIIETGIAHGGSLIYYASLFKAMGNGRICNHVTCMVSHKLQCGLSGVIPAPIFTSAWSTH